MKTLAFASRRCRGALRRRAGPARPRSRRSSRSSCATSASRARSASPRARSTTICRSTSATPSTSGGCAKSTRALFETGFFQDVEFRRDGDTLVIVVLERPSILEFTFDGNKDIKDEDLEKVLTENGLATGKTFDQLDARAAHAVVDRGVLRARQVRGEGHADRRAPRGQPRARLDPDRGGRSREDPPGQHRRQHVVRRRRDHRRLRALDGQLAVVHPATTTATRERRSKATSRSCARSTWTAASRTSARTTCRSRSRPTSATSSSRSASRKATATRSPTSSSPARWWFPRASSSA